MSEKDLRSKVIRLAHQKPKLRKHLLPLVKSASGTSWEDHTKSWFESLGKMVEKHSNKKVFYQNVHSEGVFFRIRGEDMVWVKYTNRQFEVSVGKDNYVLSTKMSIKAIASFIIDQIDNV